MIPKSIELKLQRARAHLDELDSVIEKWTVGPPNPRRLRRIRNGVPADEFRGVIRLNPPLPEAVPLLVGDAVHNLRSALDHLAQALANVNDPTNLETGHSDVEFPIHPSASEFRRVGLRRIQRLHADAQNEIAALQPHQAGEAARFELLWVLHRLDIIDKHRQITIIGGRYSVPHTLRPEAWAGNEIIADGRIYVPFNDGDEIRISPVDSDFAPSVTGTVAIRWGDQHDEIMDLDKLRVMHGYVVDSVMPRFHRFFSPT